MEIVVLIVTALAGALSTFYCCRRFMWSPVRASALLSMVVALIFKVFPDVVSPYLNQTIPVVFIGATFIGMVSSRQTTSYLGIGLAAVVYSVILFHTSEYFEGYGGALGTTACVALLVILSSRYMRSDKKAFAGSRKVVRKLQKPLRKP
ncbi:hypothetical protein [Sinomicrobium soli]|uniref:hypothetical protein n=1 Tax=Sinomicrobium sp. N-1-3-6 TaxID=2219864 RepID=UPI000DCF287E|nr:hypothetical protein [Sinomicrobium sp. N-1-3-6]RAV27879.1 hypothetical protein DN748_16600 [Sinomicrobium sp. N-1-3-6]